MSSDAQSMEMRMANAIRFLAADAVQAAMEQRGILIRPAYGQWTQYSRVSTGKIEDVARYAAALPEVIDEVGSA